MANSPSNAPIYLPSFYEADYKKALWREITEVLESFNTERGFYLREVLPTLKPHLRRIFDVNGKSLERTLDKSGDQDDIKAMQRYIKSEGKYNAGAAQTAITQIMHAYLHIKHPVRAAALEPDRATDTIGKMVGVFLRDPRSIAERFSLALDAQKILGLYSYADADTFGDKTGSNRYLVFLPGVTPDYLLCLDFFLRDIWEIPDKEYLRLQYGFCAPGKEFSPIIMKTLRDHERLAGLLYTPNALIDFHSEFLDELKMDIFTTDKSRLGKRKEEREDDDIFGAALRIFSGPRLQAALMKVNNANHIRGLEIIIARFRREYI